MRHRAFRAAVAEEFGEAHASVILRDYWLGPLGSTGDEALELGVAPRDVWAALCVEFDVPESRRHGRGLADPQE